MFEVKKETEERKKKKGGKDVINGSVPYDVKVEILSRLPVKSLLRFKTVCKQWCFLIQNPTFLNLHFERSNMEDYTCMVIKDLSKRNNNNSLYAFSLKLNGEDDPSTSFVVKYDLQPGTTFKAYCKGLICFSTKSRWEHREDLWVCNINTKEKSKIPKLPCHGFINFGLGFNPSTNKYTIVVNSSGQSGWHLFTLGADADATLSWRNITSRTPKLDFKNVERYKKYKESLCIDGVLHWNSSYPNNVIITFDLSTEEFGVLSYPTKFSSGRDSYSDGCTYEYMYEFQGNLCLFCVDYEGDVFKLWVLKDNSRSSSHSWDYHRFMLPNPFTFKQPEMIFIRNWNIAAVFSTCKDGHHLYYLHSHNLHTWKCKKIELIGLPSNANIITMGNYKNVII